MINIFSHRTYFNRLFVTFFSRDKVKKKEVVLLVFLREVGAFILFSLTLVGYWELYNIARLLE